MKADPTRMHRYAKRMLIVTAVLVGLAAAINVAVDPYSLYGWNRFGIFIGAERECKQTWLKRIPHNAILMGSSKLGFVDPRTLEVYEFFNASMGGAMPEEIEEYVRLHAPEGQPLVIGLDFFMMNEFCFPLRPSIKRDAADYWVHYPLNLKALEYCWHTVRKGLLRRPPVVTAWGQLNPEMTERKDATATQVDYSDGIPYLEHHHLRNYTFSETRLERLRELRRTLDTRKIPTVIVLNPMNEALRARIRERSDLEPQYQRWKAEMRGIFPDLIDLTESEYSKVQYFYKLDPLHFKPATGTEYLNKVIIPELGRRHAQ